MCGIVAIVSKSQEYPLSSILIKMTDLIRHRGPDDEGYVLFYEKCKEWKHKSLEKANYIKNEDIYLNSNPIINKNAEIEKLNIEKKCCLGFGHRRLSIIDLSSAGHQPMCYKNRYWITYNGEIYNFLELKTELEELGHRFVSHSDTEVILAAYDEWGINCQHRFIGMWAFLIFDSKTGILFGSRDRFGIKPLYYWFSDYWLFHQK